MNRNKRNKNIKVNKAIDHIESINSFDSLNAGKPMEYKEVINTKDKKNESDSFS